MKNKALITLAVILAIAVPITAAAAASGSLKDNAVRGFMKIIPENLTEKQKANVEEYAKKMAQLQKDFINSMVKSGAISKEQGDAAIKRIDEMLKSGEIKWFLFGVNRAKGKPGGPSVPARAIDLSKLTDQQKSDLVDSCSKLLGLHRQLVEKLAEYGIITGEQKDKMTQRIDSALENLKKDNPSGCMAAIFGAFAGRPGFGLKKSPAGLTDRQKAELESLWGKIREARKEVINKMVSYGLITKEKGDLLIDRLEKVEKTSGYDTSQMGRGRLKRSFSARVQQG